MTLAQKTITGIIWNFLEQIGRRGIGVIITLLLARFLAPEDYGLVAMMAVFLAIAQSLMDSGFKQALIRLQGAAQIDFNTAFFANIFLGIISYVLLFLSAPFIAQFYDETRLIILIRVAGINVLIHSFQVVQSALLTRELNFKAQLQATIPAGIFSGIIAVALAFNEFGVWALIVQMLLASLITTALLWRLQGWRPTRGFSRQSLSSMYNFGYKLFLSGLLESVFQNVYVVVIAKIFSTSIAGYYFFAYKLKDMVISQLVRSVQDVIYPALSTMQDDDKRLKSGSRKVIQVTTFILFPIMLLLAALAEPLFNFLLPEKWLPAALYLQLMCIASIMHPLHSINLNVLKVKGRSDLFLYREIFNKIMIIIILSISFRYGVIGILIGQIISSVLEYFPNSYFSARLINYPVREQIADFMPGLALSAVVALMIYSAGFFLNWPVFAELLSLSLMACILYLTGAHVLKIQAYILTRQMIMEKLGKR
jgi:O-antigen/teichoic acid export membrane protein